MNKNFSIIKTNSTSTNEDEYLILLLIIGEITVIIILLIILLKYLYKFTKNDRVPLIQTIY